jgi:hypothetical protein
MLGRWRSVVHDSHRPTREVDTVERPIETERLPETAGPARQIAVAPRLAAPRPHHLEAGERHRGSEQHRVWCRPRAAHRVRAPVHPVRQVHVQRPGPTEHRGIPRRGASVRVAAGIVGTGVRLDLHQSRSHRSRDEHLVQQLGRDGERVAVVELAREGYLSSQ